VDGCDDYELRVVKDVTHSVVNALRENESLRQWRVPATMQ